MPAEAPPTQSICATFLPARSAALAIVSAWRMPPENEVELAKESPPRWKVLFVEPCSEGYVPVAIVYQPTPVLGGNAWTMPLSPVTPSFISFLYVGMAPAFAYFSIRSGRIPSDANITTLSAGAILVPLGAGGPRTEGDEHAECDDPQHDERHASRKPSHTDPPPRMPQISPQATAFPTSTQRGLL